MGVISKLVVIRIRVLFILKGPSTNTYNPYNFALFEILGSSVFLGVYITGELACKRSYFKLAASWIVLYRTKRLMIYLVEYTQNICSQYADCIIIYSVRQEAEIGPSPFNLLTLIQHFTSAIPRPWVPCTHQGSTSSSCLNMTTTGLEPNWTRAKTVRTTHGFPDKDSTPTFEFIKMLSLSLCQRENRCPKSSI